MTSSDLKTIKGIETQPSTILKQMENMEADSETYELYLKIREARD